MDTTIKFDRVILVKELNEKFRKVGEVFEIASILNDSSFLLRDAKTRVALGVVSFEDFEKCFVSEGNFKGWTKWESLATDYEDGLKMFYRVKDRHKVQVKTLDGCVGESCCNNKHGDNFNLQFGLNLAFLRCIRKMYNNRIEYHQKEINIYTNELKDIEHKLNIMNNGVRQK